MALSIDNVSQWVVTTRCTRAGVFADDHNRVTKDDLMGYHEGFDVGQPRPVFRDATEQEIRRMDAAIAASRRPAHTSRVSKAPQRWSADASGWEDDGYCNSDAESIQGDETEEDEEELSSDDESETSDNEQDQQDLGRELGLKAKRGLSRKSPRKVKRGKFDTLVGGGHLCMQDKLSIVALGFQAPPLQTALRRADRYILRCDTDKLSDLFDDLVAECEPRGNLRPFVMVPSLHGGFAPVGQVTQEVLSLMQYADRDYLRELSCKVDRIITHIKNIE